MHTVSKTFYATLQRIRNWSLVVVPFGGQAGNALQEVWVIVNVREGERKGNGEGNCSRLGLSDSKSNRTKRKMLSSVFCVCDMVGWRQWCCDRYLVGCISFVLHYGHACVCIFIRAASGLDGIVYVASGLHGSALQDVWSVFCVCRGFIHFCLYAFMQPPGFLISLM